MNYLRHVSDWTLKEFYAIVLGLWAVTKDEECRELCRVLNIELLTRDSLRRLSDGN